MGLGRLTVQVRNGVRADEDVGQGEDTGSPGEARRKKKRKGGAWGFNATLRCATPAARRSDTPGRTAAHSLFVTKL